MIISTQTLGDRTMVNVTRLLLKRHHRLAASVAVAFMLLLSAVPIAQALTFGSAIRMSTNTGYSERASVAAMGNYVYVAWDDDTPVSGSGTAPEIWLGVSSNNGASFGSALRITTNTYVSVYPSVAANGSYVYVAWEDNTPVSGSGGLYEIWLRVSSNYGASFGSAIRITTNTGNSLYPSVAAVGNYVYVAWDDDTPVSGSYGQAEIWMRVSSNNGASFGSAIRISTNTYASLSPSVAAVGSNVYVAWQDNTPVTGNGGTYEIWMRASSDNGGSFGSAIRISRNTGASWNTSVAAAGKYVYVAWEDNTAVTGSDSAPEIWLRVSSNYGASFGSAIRISTNTGWSTFPSVAANGSYVYVAWQDDTPVSGSGTAPEIWMRFSSNYGVSFGSAIRISTNTGTSSYPSVAAVGSNVCVAWMDDTPVTGSGSSYEVWFRVGS
jgi:hypothetical protein